MKDSKAGGDEVEEFVWVLEGLKSVIANKYRWSALYYLELRATFINRILMVSLKATKNWGQLSLTKEVSFSKEQSLHVNKTKWLRINYK